MQGRVSRRGMLFAVNELVPCRSIVEGIPCITHESFSTFDGQCHGPRLCGRRTRFYPYPQEQPKLLTLLSQAPIRIAIVSAAYVNMSHSFSQVDVFASEGLTGNPVAVVHDADDLSDEQMQSLARWTNLSETAFLLQATHPDAHYRVRIFTPGCELPFAGHPTLGSAYAWLLARKHDQDGAAWQNGVVVQECGIGLVHIRYDHDTLMLKAPELHRHEPIDSATLDQALSAMNLSKNEIVEARWIVNGPRWMGFLLRDAQAVLAVDPDIRQIHKFGFHLGLIGAHASGMPAHFEVRAFAEGFEDPATGSLNAALAMWLIRSNQAPKAYTVRQGTAIGRRGDVRVMTDEQGDIWVQGRCVRVIRGELCI